LGRSDGRDAKEGREGSVVTGAEGWDKPPREASAMWAIHEKKVATQGKRKKRLLPIKKKSD
jgi:hypothetical protein